MRIMCKVSTGTKSRHIDSVHIFTTGIYDETHSKIADVDKLFLPALYMPNIYKPKVAQQPLIIKANFVASHQF